MAQAVKSLPNNAGDLHLITGSGRSPPPALWRPLSVGPNRQEVS